jgi:hypothetical protein
LDVFYSPDGQAALSAMMQQPPWPLQPFLVHALAGMLGAGGGLVGIMI